MKTDSVTFDIRHQKRNYSVTFERSELGWRMVTLIASTEFSLGPSGRLRPSIGRAERFLKSCIEDKRNGIPRG